MISNELAKKIYKAAFKKYSDNYWEGDVNSRIKKQQELFTAFHDLLNVLLFDDKYAFKRLNIEEDNARGKDGNIL